MTYTTIETMNGDGKKICGLKKKHFTWGVLPILLLSILVIISLLVYLPNENENVRKMPIDPNIRKVTKPCKSFCRYVCNNSLKFNISTDSVQGGCGSKTKAVNQSIIDEEIIDLLEKPNTDSTIEPVKMVKKFYTSCINQVEREKTMQPYWSYIFDELKERPTYRKHTSMLRDYLRISGHLPWFKYTIENNRYGKTIILELDCVYNTYSMQSIMDDIITFQNIYPDYADYENIWAFFFKMFMMVRKHVLNVDDTGRNIYNHSNIHEDFPNFLILNILNDILKENGESLDQYNLKIPDRNLLKNINNLIINTNIQDFLLIVLLEIFQDLYAQFPILRKEFAETQICATGTLSRISQRKKDCSLSVHILKEIRDWMYIEKYFDKQLKDRANSIRNYLQKATKVVLSESKWLDEQSKENALYKLEVLGNNTYIGTKHAIIRQELIKYYANVNLTDDFVSNAFILKKAHRNVQNMQMFKNDVNNVLKTNGRPTYSKSTDSIYIPLDSLQSPLFTKDGNMVINFGGIGMLIGREIFRAFQIDDTNYTNNLWLSESSFTIYKQLRSDIKTYSQYGTDPQSTSMNAEMAADEIFADAISLKIASKAFFMWKSENTDAETYLPSLKMTDLQTFFFAFAHNFCSSEQINPETYSYNSNIFTPDTARVHKLLQNSQEFANAFQCPQGARMNREPKIKL